MTSAAPGSAQGNYLIVSDIEAAGDELATQVPTRTGQANENWPDWYADYMVREQDGTDLPV